MTGAIEVDDAMRTNCVGVVPLGGRVESWMKQVIAIGDLHDLVTENGSPLNLLHLEPFRRNVASLRQVAEQRSMDFQIYFARKANKCREFVQAAMTLDAGIDTASAVELAQSLQCGVDPSKIICTAAIKDSELLSMCVQRQVTVAIDNQDELHAIARIARDQNRTAIVALRVSGFRHEGQKLHSRFGIDVDDVDGMAQQCGSAASGDAIRLCGIQFHLDGYSAGQRVSAIGALLPWIDSLRSRGHEIHFLDVGGGFPMSYLESEYEWNDFWSQHELALRGERSEVTYRNHPLGRQVCGDAGCGKRVTGRPNIYPNWQHPVQQQWLATVLDAPCGNTTVASEITRRGLQLRCEPGRSLLDGCGMTVARVEYRKRHPDGYWLIGLSMNRTQCRTSTDDFLIDPLLVPADVNAQERTAAIQGYLVGAYCTESELISLQRLRFDRGVAVGDLIVFPNTAGYQMHFMESRSHQFPLAKNLVASDRDLRFRLTE